MKRLGLFVVAVLMSANVFANNDGSAKEPFSASLYQLSSYLNLTAAQIDEVEAINTYFIEKQKESLRALPSVQEQKMQEAIYGNLKLMKKVLTNDQYRKYVMLVNITNNNNRLMGISSVNDVYLAENN